MSSVLSGAYSTPTIEKYDRLCRVEFCFGMPSAQVDAINADAAKRGIPVTASVTLSKKWYVLRAADDTARFPYFLVNYDPAETVDESGALVGGRAAGALLGFTATNDDEGVRLGVEYAMAAERLHTGLMLLQMRRQDAQSRPSQ